MPDLQSDPFDPFARIEAGDRIKEAHRYRHGAAIAHARRELQGMLEGSLEITAPYKPGDRILHRGAPHLGADTVTACTRHPHGGWTISYVRGSVCGTVHDSRAIRAPADWQDAPQRPAREGSVAYGLSQRDWDQKLANDAADPEYQAAIARWRQDYVRWEEEHLAPLLAGREG